MLPNSFKALVVLSILSISQPAVGRYQWLERDNRALSLYPRRFGQENPAVLTDLANACGNGVCATLAGQAISTLLAGAAECAQQDMADQIIDAASQFDAATATKMIDAAVTFRQAEKNTPPDFTSQPPTLRNSVFCLKAPKNSQLNGLVQAQDPANDPDLFFDPATKKTVVKGSQPNTIPPSTAGSTDEPVAEAPAATLVGNNRAVASASVCSLLTVTVSSTDVPSATDAVTVSVTETTAAAESTTTFTGSSSIGNFGKCSVPQIEFGAGFDGRRETSFQPVDKVSYNHGSAQDINIITQFMCDALVNTCGADQTAKNTCATAKAAVSSVTAGNGGQADVFNAVFDIITDFALVSVIDDQGRTISAGSGSASTVVASTTAAANTAIVTSASDAEETTIAPSTTAAGAAESTAVAGNSIGDFGKCSVPEIEFGAGFDGRKETSFQPVDKVSYNHGSAQNINIITQFMCDALVNTCGADQTAKNTCAQAQAAVANAPAGEGGQADLFNAVFDIKTDFAAVTEIDNQGNAVPGTGNGNVGNAAPSGNNAGGNVNVVANPTPTATQAAAAPAQTTAAAAAAAPSGGNLQDFAGALGGVAAPGVTALANGRFQVDGNADFPALQNALERSCDVQNNLCSNAANASGNKAGLTVQQCGQQQQQCLANAQSA